MNLMMKTAMLGAAAAIAALGSEPLAQAQTATARAHAAGQSSSWG